MSRKRNKTMTVATIEAPELVETLGTVETFAETTPDPVPDGAVSTEIAPFVRTPSETMANSMVPLTGDMKELDELRTTILENARGHLLSDTEFYAAQGKLCMEYLAIGYKIGGGQHDRMKQDRASLLAKISDKLAEDGPMDSLRYDPNIWVFVAAFAEFDERVMEMPITSVLEFRKYYNRSESAETFDEWTWGDHLTERDVMNVISKVIKARCAVKFTRETLAQMVAVRTAEYVAGLSAKEKRLHESKVKADRIKRQNKLKDAIGDGLLRSMEKAGMDIADLPAYLYDKGLIGSDDMQAIDPTACFTDNMTKADAETLAKALLKSDNVDAIFTMFNILAPAVKALATDADRPKDSIVPKDTPKITLTNVQPR